MISLKYEFISEENQILWPCEMYVLCKSCCDLVERDPLF